MIYDVIAIGLVKDETLSVLLAPMTKARPGATPEDTPEV